MPPVQEPGIIPPSSQAPAKDCLGCHWAIPSSRCEIGLACVTRTSCVSTAAQRSKTATTITTSTATSTTTATTIPHPPAPTATTTATTGVLCSSAHWRRSKTRSSVVSKTPMANGMDAKGWIKSINLTTFSAAFRPLPDPPVVSVCLRVISTTLCALIGHLSIAGHLFICLSNSWMKNENLMAQWNISRNSNKLNWLDRAFFNPVHQKCLPQLALQIGFRLPGRYSLTILERRRPGIITYHISGNQWAPTIFQEEQAPGFFLPKQSECDHIDVWVWSKWPCDRPPLMWNCGKITNSINFFLIHPHQSKRDSK